MAWSLINFGFNDQGTGNPSGTYDITGATLIVVTTSYAGSDVTVVSDSESNSYTAVGSAHGSVEAGMFYVENPVTDAAWTFQADDGSFAGLCFVAYSGNGASPLDQHDENTSAGSNPFTTDSITPTQNGCLVVATFSGDGSNTPTVDSPFTVQAFSPDNGGVAYKNTLAVYEQATAASIAATFNNGGSDAYSGVIASFKPAGGGGGGNPWYAYAQQ